MKSQMAFCGLYCHKCPIFLATKTNNLKEKRRLAPMFSMPKRKLNLNEIECYGCTQIGEKILKGCDTCKIRLCAIKRKVENCGICSKYPCQQLDYLLTRLWQSGARERLDRAHKTNTK
jgi:Protein of unknown function (DUF3795)